MHIKGLDEKYTASGNEVAWGKVHPCRDRNGMMVFYVPVSSAKIQNRYMSLVDLISPTCICAVAIV